MDQPIFINSTDVLKAQDCHRESKLILDTPLLIDVGHLFGLPKHIDLNLKLESMQTNGSFKIRGVLNQFDKKLKDKSTDKLKLVTFSAGNYGKAFSFLCAQRKLKGKVLLPSTAAQSRIQYIHDQSLETELYESGELLLKGVNDHVRDGWELFHPLDDLNLIAGYAPLASEILAKVQPDIVLVCCGGGALLAGVSSGLALSNSKALVYGIEPETACTMHQSFKKNSPAVDYSSKSIAGGLAPPLAGVSAYYHCKKHVKDIILITEEEIVQTCRVLFDKGLKVEPSGCAAMAALLFNKIPNVDIHQENNTSERIKIVVLLSGGNVSALELVNLFQSTP